MRANDLFVLTPTIQNRLQFRDQSNNLNPKDRWQKYQLSSSSHDESPAPGQKQAMTSDPSSLHTYGSIGSVVHQRDANDQDSTVDPTSPNGSSRRCWAAVLFGILVLVTTKGNDITSHDNSQRFSLLGSPLEQLEENKPCFYKEQLVDHFADEDEDADEHWSHRYYLSTKYWKGGGYPIFLVVGGEGALDHGMLYPFVTEHLAKQFGAAVIQAEHRFYGPYKPMQQATVKDLLKLLTPQQAMADMIRLYTHHLRPTVFQECSSNTEHCPFITVGASYPGFLSAMLRVVHGNVVDAAYASSAPLRMYAQQTRDDPNIYYDIVTATAEAASPGCSRTVRWTLQETATELRRTSLLENAATQLGICADTIPSNVSGEDLADALIKLASYAFADYDMTYYPPGPERDLTKICKVFQDPDLDSFDTVAAFLKATVMAEVEDDLGCDLKWVHCTVEQVLAAYKAKTGGRDCYAMFDDDTKEEAAVKNGDIVPGDDGSMWNFQTCTSLIFVIGLSKQSLFPVAHDETYENSLQKLKKECMNEFGTTPRPHELVEEMGFDDLVGNGASRILFTNGLRDMWSGGGVLEDVSDSLLAITFPNGAHHSDLTHEGPSAAVDTEDIKAGYTSIAAILEAWIADIKVESAST